MAITKLLTTAALCPFFLFQNCLKNVSPHALKHMIPIFCHIILKRQWNRLLMTFYLDTTLGDSKISLNTINDVILASFNMLLTYLLGLFRLLITEILTKLYCLAFLIKKLLLVLKSGHKWNFATGH